MEFQPLIRNKPKKQNRRYHTNQETWCLCQGFLYKRLQYSCSYMWYLLSFSQPQKISVGLIIITEKLGISWALHPEEMEDWDLVLKTSWYFLTTDRMFLVFFLPFKSVLQISAKFSRAGLCSMLSKSLAPSIQFDCWILIISINAGNPWFCRIMLILHMQFKKQAVIWKHTSFHSVFLFCIVQPLLPQ